MKPVTFYIRKQLLTLLLGCVLAVACVPRMTAGASESLVGVSDPESSEKETAAPETQEGTAAETQEDTAAGNQEGATAGTSETAAPETQETAASEASESPELNAVITALSDFIAGKAAAGEDWSAGFIDLTALESCYLESESMQAASLIKLFIMGAVYESYDSLCASYGTDHIDTLLYNMITVSDNDAANTLTNYLGQGDDASGRQVVSNYCLANGYNDSVMGRMLLAPTDNGDNYTSVKDCCHFLLKVYNNEIDHAAEMLALLKNQQRTHKIPQGVPEGVETANKTGELSNVENDAAIIFAAHPYILVVMSQQLSDVGTAQSNIASLSSTVYYTLNP